MVYCINTKKIMSHLLSLPSFLTSHAVEIKDAIMGSKNIEILTCLQKKIIVAHEEELIALIGFLSSSDYPTHSTTTMSKAAYLAVISAIKARVLILSCCSELCHKDILLVLEKLAL